MGVCTSKQSQQKRKKAKGKRQSTIWNVQPVVEPVPTVIVSKKTTKGKGETYATDETDPKLMESEIAFSRAAGISISATARKDDMKDNNTSDNNFTSTSPLPPKRKYVKKVWREYELVEQLGTGGYGQVLCVRETLATAKSRAERSTSGTQSTSGRSKSKRRVLAMKVVDRVRGGKQMGKRFWREVDALRLIAQTPGRPKSMLKYVDSFYDEEKYYLLTELLTGGDLLKNVLDEEKCSFSERKASEIVSSMLQSVKFLHSQHIVHLDLKPENFVFSCKECDYIRGKTPVLKLVDFGCALHVLDHEVCTIQNGTLHFMAPELLNSRIAKTGVVLRACDMWSIGVIVFFLVTGRRPFYGSANEEIMSSVLKGEYEIPGELNLSSEIRDLISKLLCTDLTKRYTAEQALQHPWLAEGERLSDLPVDSQVLDRIRDHARNTKLKKAIVSVLVNEINCEEQERARIVSTFSSLDLDHDGILQYADIVLLLEKNGQEKQEAEEQASKLMTDFGGDGKNGAIDVLAFAQFAIRNKLSDDDAFVSDLFDYIDRDGDGYIVRDELDLYFESQSKPEFAVKFDSTVVLEPMSKEDFLFAMKC